MQTFCKEAAEKRFRNFLRVWKMCCSDAQRGVQEQGELFIKNGVMATPLATIRPFCAFYGKRMQFELKWHLILMAFHRFIQSLFHQIIINLYCFVILVSFFVRTANLLEQKSVRKLRIFNVRVFHKFTAKP